MTVYSETAYSRAYYNNIIYLLFESFQYGYVYIDVAEAARACAVIDFTNVDRNVKLGKTNIKDFI